MQPADVFGVVVRTIGLLIFLNGIWNGLHAASLGVGMSKSERPTSAFVIAAIFFLLAGGVLLTAANSIVGAVYR